MTRASTRLRPLGISLMVLLAACSNDSTDPGDIVFGETTAVVLVNPIVNDANQDAMPAPGATRAGVDAEIDGGPAATTDANGIAVLSPLNAGLRTLSLVNGSDLGSLSLQADDGSLQEVAVALTGGGAALMARIDYALGGQAVEITPAMSIAEVNEALAQSNTIVFFKSGTYSGDLAFTGSNVTLFGEGTMGGSVTLNGNVSVDGSANRIRGARITGDLSVPGSDFGLSFTRVAGSTSIEGSDPVLLNNVLCGQVTISGSGAQLLGNSGLAPIPAPAGGC